MSCYDPSIHEIRPIPNFATELEKMYRKSLEIQSLQEQTAFLYGEFRTALDDLKDKRPVLNEQHRSRLFDIRGII